MALNPSALGKKKTAAPETDDMAAKRFINQSPDLADASASKKKFVPHEGTRKPTQIRFKRDLLARIDAAAERRSITRSAFIHMAVARLLEEDNF